MHTFELRLTAWVKRLEQAKPCKSQIEAFHLLKSEWLAISEAFDMPRSYVDGISAQQLSEKDGWTQTADGTFFEDSTESPFVRTYIHADGAIVLQRVKGEGQAILFNLPADASVFARTVDSSECL